MQFYGVETYYEFVSNLNQLNDISTQLPIPIIVKLHPSAQLLKPKLNKIYPKLVFTNESLSKLLERALVTVSFSSTVIEDSIYSRTPVILFDPWKRYKHCWAETNVNVKNKAIYYVVNTNDLINAFYIISESNYINYEEYTYPGKVDNNIKNLYETLL